MTVLARRQLLGGFAGLPLSAVLADPRLLQRAAGGLETLTATTSDGRRVSAALALPVATPAPTVLLVHEWWGLNDQIKTVAGALAAEGYVALAVDLYDGEVATAPDEARNLMQAVDPAQALDTLVTWAGLLRTHEKATGKLATIGWCFGGGWSLNTAIATPVDATIVYYGRVNRTAGDLAALKGPVLGHYATDDKWINRDMVEGFEAAMTEAGKPFESHWYEADHAFANPTGGRYDEADAKLAWERSLAFLAAHLKA